MTVIAYRNGIIAADKQSTYGSVKRKLNKIFNIVETGAVIGVTGDISASLALIEWYKNGSKKEDWPQAIQDTDDWAQLIVVDKNGCKWYDRRPYPHYVQDEFTAWGCGSEFAIGAMAMGADAIKAVSIACEFCDGCGMGIDWFDLGKL